MPTDFAFRLSTYLTLTLSCLCIWYAEWDILPEIGLVAGGAIVAFGILFRLETRMELLSIAAAQRLGVILALVSLLWGAGRLLWERQHNELQNMPWMLMFAVMFGLFLISLMPAKLARREKHAGDYWFLHGMALVIVCLAGVIAEDSIIFSLIVLYVCLAVWSLSLLYLMQAGGAILPAPVESATKASGAVVANSGKKMGMLRALGFIVAPSAFAIPLYIATPRSMGEKHSFGYSKMEIGFSADQMTDLNKTGDLKATDAIAFEVEAEQDGQPKTDLSTDQRWRGRILQNYQKGVWSQDINDKQLPGIAPLDNGALLHTTRGGWTPPNLGAGQFRLTFTIPGKQLSEFLADPVVWARGQDIPVASSTPSGYSKWLWGINGPFLLKNYNKSETESSAEPRQYVQIWRPEKDPDLGPSFELNRAMTDETLIPLRRYPSKLKEYADALLNELVRTGKLPANWQDQNTFWPRSEFHERIAREFSHHLATTPELKYTASLRREVKNIDPVEDFLFHTRAGHCERFASALALLLRSEGIPSVLVLGYKGCEPTEVPGKYVVREEYAHAWVAAIIQDDDLPEKPGRRASYRWLSLDPTPSGGSATDSALVNEWVQPALSWLQKMYRNFISNYTPEQRRRALSEVLTLATKTETLATLLAVVLGVVLVRHQLRRRKNPASLINRSLPAWYNQLIAHLNAWGFKQDEGETPFEFATRAANSLRINPVTAAIADLPLDCVDAYYESRFGRKELTTGRLAKLEQRLHEFIRMAKPN